MMSLAQLRRTYLRASEKLVAAALDRHELIDTATLLLLLADGMEMSLSRDVSGHAFVQGTGPDRALESMREQLWWIRQNAQTAPVEEIRAAVERARRAGGDALKALD